MPGKALRAINGQPMIAHTYRNASNSGASEVVVATDDDRIADCVKGFGGDCCMTSGRHPSGTDRVGEVAELKDWGAETIVINLQGDEPFIEGAALTGLAAELGRHGDAAIATLASPHEYDENYANPDRVKVVRDEDGYALYFSRAAVPSGGNTWLCHHGVYACRRGYLQRFAALAQPYIEKREGLEQLRAMAAGDRIYVHLIDAPAGFGVDREADLKAAS